jgi:hypothetical protein
LSGQLFQASFSPPAEHRSEISQERAAWLAVVPMLATAVYYTLPRRTQQHVWITFLPQVLGYASLAIWAARNGKPFSRLTLQTRMLQSGVRWGVLVGVLLAALNLAFILIVFPALGGEIRYLRDTPHGQAPVWVMVPVGITAIGILVELNFRGFQLGRLLSLLGGSGAGRAIAVGLTAFAFAWDPFLVYVFRSLHWIAVWDGVVWGILFLRTGTLYATMTAHIVEVCIVYGFLKWWLG